MKKYKELLFQLVGAAGLVTCLFLFVRRPSFPTPDKLLVFLTFVFMVLKDAKAMLVRLGPFAAVILVYESFRSVADTLNSHVNYTLAPSLDKAVFGQLPTHTLQRWWWHGQVRWYDYVFYLAYMLHFILPFLLAILIWKLRPRNYWSMITTYLTVAFSAFLTFLAFPAAPPWLASQKGAIQPITRISSDVWSALGLKDFPSLYNHLAANPVAAVPSLHSAWATLFLIFVYKDFGKRWALLAASYPLLIYVGTVYQGEHYAFDVVVGIIYAVVGYLVTPPLIRLLRLLFRKAGKKPTGLIR